MTKQTIETILNTQNYTRKNDMIHQTLTALKSSYRAIKFRIHDVKARQTRLEESIIALEARVDIMAAAVGDMVAGMDAMAVNVDGEELGD